jgi:hypothetical protein
LNCFVGAHGRSGVVCESLFLPVELTEARKGTALVIIVIETEHAANRNTIQGLASGTFGVRFAGSNGSSRPSRHESEDVQAVVGT